MLPLSAILLTIALFGGVAMLALRRRGERFSPLALVVPHGLVVLAATAALVTAVREQTVPAITLVALCGFIVATAVGTVLFFRFHQQRKTGSASITYVTRAVVAISVIMFLVSLFGP